MLVWLKQHDISARRSAGGDGRYRRKVRVQDKRQVDKGIVYCGIFLSSRFQKVRSNPPSDSGRRLARHLSPNLFRSPCQAILNKDDESVSTKDAEMEMQSETIVA